MSQQASTSSEKVFGPIRSCFWPVHRHEAKKAYPYVFDRFFDLCQLQYLAQYERYGCCHSFRS